MSILETDVQREREAIVQDFHEPFADFGIKSLTTDDKFEGKSTSDLRRRRKRRKDDSVGIMALVDDGNVLRWEFGAGSAPARRPGRRRGGRKSTVARRTPSGQIMHQWSFKDLPPNDVAKQLIKLDEYLTPRQGLWQIDKATFDQLESRPVKTPSEQLKMKPVKANNVPTNGRILLFIHGTFSNCPNMIHDIAQETDGLNLLRDVVVKKKNYDKVLAFNHPTLSVSPIMNAVTLAKLFRESDAEIDIICHSRGGLVSRWWLEMLDQFRPNNGRAARGKVVFGGSPLAGTGLAAPYRLRGALNVLANLAEKLKALSNLVGYFPVVGPLGHAVGILFSLFGKITSFAANTPILDAGVSMIPGIAAQSQVGSNGEILRLRDSLETRTKKERQERFIDNYHFLLSNFQPEDPGWRFWRHFRKDQLANSAVDMVFEGANDLVVDTWSMDSLFDNSKVVNGNVLHFEDEKGSQSSKIVHHLNYFRQKETIAHIRKWLAI